MDILEDMGGCLTIAIVAVILLFLVLCVAVVFFGWAISDIF